MKAFFLRLIIATLFYLPVSALAHKSSDSYLTIDIDPQGQISGQWDIALRDLDILLPVDSNSDRRITWGEMLQAEPGILSLASRSLSIHNESGSCRLHAGSAPLAINRHADGNHAVIYLQGHCRDTGAITLRYQLLDGIDADHRSIARIQLHDTDQTIILAPGETITISNYTNIANWLGHVREGMHHIATGYDHLLFLFSLLLPVALMRRDDTPNSASPSAWRDTVMLVTAFTIAHSVTLALATFDILSLPGKWVESAIAASVIVAALQNLRDHAPRTRWIMAFVFGLVHGLGFAAMLGELPSSTGQKLLALAGFNIGVELGQLLAVMIFLPIAILLARTNRLGYRRWGLQGGSLAIAAVGLVWLCQRLFEWQLFTE